MSRHGSAGAPWPTTGLHGGTPPPRRGVDHSCEWVGAHLSHSTLVFPQPARKLAKKFVCSSKKEGSKRPLRRMITMWL